MGERLLRAPTGTRRVTICDELIMCLRHPDWPPQGSEWKLVDFLPGCLRVYGLMKPFEVYGYLHPLPDSIHWALKRLVGVREIQHSGGI